MHASDFCEKAQGKGLHCISTFGLLSSSQFLCTLTHLSAVTNDGGMIVILQQDHKLFRTLNSCCKNIKKMVVALSGKKKKGT